MRAAPEPVGRFGAPRERSRDEILEENGRLKERITRLEEDCRRLLEERMVPGRP